MYKACKSSGFRPAANGLVTRRNLPLSREQPGEIRNNTRWSRKSKGFQFIGILDKEEPASYQLVGKVMAYQGYDG